MSLTKRDIPTTHADALALLAGRASRSISHNGRLGRDGDDVVLRLHDTDIARFHADGSLSVRHGGYVTVTTFSWLNRALRGTSVRVWRHKFNPYIGTRDERISFDGTARVVPGAVLTLAIVERAA